MRILYLDCFNGISGDMFLAALIDAGLPIRRLRAELAKLRIAGYDISSGKKTVSAHLTARTFTVVPHSRHSHCRSPKEIARIIKGSRLSAGVKRDALAIFGRLSEAEAVCHGSRHGEVHFHEIGDIDSIVDIVGAAIGVGLLRVSRVYASNITLGRGVVKTRAGDIPVPSPAALYLLKGLEVTFSEIGNETVTPTGAAILSALAKPAAGMPQMKIESVGCGAGKAVIPERPNMLRAVIGEAEVRFREDAVVVIETNIDDMSPVNMGGIYDAVLANGALDVFVTPVNMKKCRPAFQLTVIAPEERLNRLSETIFRETTTTGLRYSRVSRYKLERTVSRVKTEYGDISVKVRRLPGGRLDAVPEYEECRRAASKRGVPFAEVYGAAKRKADDGHHKG